MPRSRLAHAERCLREVECAGVQLIRVQHADFYKAQLVRSRCAAAEIDVATRQLGMRCAVSFGVVRELVERVGDYLVGYGGAGSEREDGER
jgi:hypothetical protein